MRGFVIAEPELEFGGAQRHIDPRVGVALFGPADVETPSAPTIIPMMLRRSRRLTADIGESPLVHGPFDWSAKLRVPKRHGLGAFEIVTAPA